MTFHKRTIRDVPLEGKTVLVRVDYNVPLETDGSIADDYRIRSSLPTLRYLLKHGCKIVLVSHLGRPEGAEQKYSLEPAALRLAELLNMPIRFVDKTIGERVRMAIKLAPSRSITVLENLRFHAEEEANDVKFARQIAKDTGARYFVQDGFGVVHRAHTSTSAITQFLPSVAGLLLEKEYATITRAMRHPQRPLVAVMGGAKVSDKIPIIDEFVKVADTIIIGGAMANTFLAFRGYDMGKSKYETDQNQTIENIYNAAEAKVGKDNVDKFLVLPTDLAVAKDINETAERRSISIKSILADDIALDLGDDSIGRAIDIINGAATTVWNGTLGYAELPQFAHGSARVALAMATHPTMESIIGGGDTADFALHWDAAVGDSFDHVSTGGGASLELMAGEKLPGIEQLLDA